jgi:glycosyltransferase involved in cell wall biosynthesis
MKSFVSIIIPARNEERFIAKCLDSILEQDYPKENLEVFVVDGASTDKTREIVKNYSQKYGFIKLLDNPRKITPVSINIGIKESRGDIIIRIDAHSSYEKEYISKCVRYLNEYNVDNVGGVMITIPRENTFLGRAIVAVLSHRFGVGNAIFRTGVQKPVFVDTIFGGCYRKNIFEKIGYFNENLPRGQDMDLNIRIRKSGGKILLAPEIKSFYYAQSGFWSFLKHSFIDGKELIIPLKFAVVIFSWRHLIPLSFVLSLITFGLLGFFWFEFLWLFVFILCSYLLANFYFSVKISLVQKDFRYLFFAPVAFALLHIGYGSGSIYGLLIILKSKLFWKNFKNILNK